MNNIGALQKKIKRIRIPIFFSILGLILLCNNTIIPEARAQEMAVNIQDIGRAIKTLDAAVDYRSEKIEKENYLAAFLSELQYGTIAAQFSEVGLPKIIPPKEFPEVEIDGQESIKQLIQLTTINL